MLYKVPKKYNFSKFNFWDIYTVIKYLPQYFNEVKKESKKNIFTDFTNYKRGKKNE